MLVNTIDKMTKVIPTIVDDDLSKFDAYLVDARRWLKREITGSDLYDLLETILVAELPAEPTDEQRAAFAQDTYLLALAEAIIAYKAYYEAIPFIDLIGTSSGFAVTRTDTKAPASKERVEALRQATLKSVGETIENLLEFLEEHEDYHDEWKGSPAYSMLSDTFILTVREFRKYAQFDGSRLEWIKLHPQMMNAIRLKIDPRISSDLSDQILEQLRDGDLTDKNKAILENLRFAFANFTIGNNDLAESYLVRVRNVIMKKPDDYPAFRDSDLYASIIANTIEKNKTGNSIFRAGL
ncbi:MAG: hypothetical protein A2066_00215 [Bacteroidetes bacterium GWB2_41_8]|nr:MAG: hypothetical protein A2066_00215 [Bacteroidetes bacterium GWB2_41_8]